MEALKIAEVTFPFAIETITTEEETVEGRLARKNMESHVTKNSVSFTKP